ncbi:MAG TPA: D-cysteine desulfhydrase family protein [Vicinamibacterales bacterium]|jgi:D-cysteine desulfhydrase family pyridoxal phosphate-dependent enzyme|nr:D-cysteine desulfhydrase family protein [Vicinamibacterales bacterium]
MKDLPRYPLAQLPTPITDAVRLREALGGPSKCPRILIKRDDLTGLGLGGNKARKLEYLIADALAKGAHTVITTGAVQSNHARMTAAAACIAGLRCVLVLTSRHAVPPIEGNLLLDRLFGAEVRFVPAEDPMLAVGRDEEVVADVTREETAAGRIPYVIPVGGSSPVGALGYVSGTDELVRQLQAMGASPSRLYFGSGSRGTQAGLTLGAKLSRASYALWGVAVSAGEAQKVVRAMNAANEAATLLDVPIRVERSDLFTDQGFIGEGYGIPTPLALESIDLLARTEAILLDPVYTSKGFSALMAHVRTGDIPPTDTVVFLHTGGMPALFTREFAAARR